MPKAKRYCIAAGCRNSDRRSDCSFFVLPSNKSENEKKRCQKWLTLLGREDILEKKNFNKNSYKVCSAHFDISSIITNGGGRKFLKGNAIPTLQLANKPPEAISTQFGEARTLMSKSKDKETSVVGKGSIDQCRFCGSFSKYWSVVHHKPYVTNNKTKLAFNDISVSVDFNDDYLPKTVCSDCDGKLQQIHDFVKAVKAAQHSLINVSVTEKEDEIETIVVKTEYEETEDDDDDKKDGILDSLTVSETVFIKETKTPQKRKSEEDIKPKSKKPETKANTVNKAKKAKVTEASDSEKCEDDVLEFVVDTNVEGIKKEADCNTEFEANDIGAYVKPSELELATSDLVYQMGNDEASGYTYRDENS